MSYLCSVLGSFELMCKLVGPQMCSSLISGLTCSALQWPNLRAWNAGLKHGPETRAWNTGLKHGPETRAWNTGLKRGPETRAWNTGLKRGNSGQRVKNGTFRALFGGFSSLFRHLIAFTSALCMQDSNSAKKISPIALFFTLEHCFKSSSRYRGFPPPAV